MSVCLYTAFLDVISEFYLINLQVTSKLTYIVKSLDASHKVSASEIHTSVLLMKI